MLRITSLLMVIGLIVVAPVFGQKGTIAPRANLMSVQDDTSGDFLTVDMQTTAFNFHRCIDNVNLSGAGTVKPHGCFVDYNFAQNNVRISATIDTCSSNAKALVEVFDQQTYGPIVNAPPMRDSLNDANTLNNAMDCGGPTLK
jgi:hypothetical protein